MSIHNRNASLGRDTSIQVASLSMILSTFCQDFIQCRLRWCLGRLGRLRLTPGTVGLAMMLLENGLQNVLSLMLGGFLSLLMGGLHLFQPSSSMFVRDFLFCHWCTHLKQFGIDLFQGCILMVQAILQSLDLQLCLMKVLLGKLELNVLQLHCCLQLCLAAAGSKKP